MVKISVVMPVYNAESFIERAIDSIYEQTLKDVEVICVNDGSTDNSVKILEDLQKKYDSIRIINQENMGSGKARNNGMKNATGEYIAFLDADDIFVDDDALEKMYNHGINNDAVMVGANLTRVNNEGELEENFNYAARNYMYFSKEDVIESEDYGIPWAFYKNIFKTSFIQENNIIFPDLLRGQDPVFLAEILTRIDKIYVVNSDLYGYYYDAAGKANDKINTIEKKRDYISHYKETFDIINSDNYESMYESYKNEFINILKIKEREQDDEYIQLVYEIFPDIEEYFDKDSYAYTYLKLVEPSDNSFDKILETKAEYIETILTNDKFIGLENLLEYNKQVENIHDENFLKESFSQLSNIQKKEQNGYNRTNNKIQRINQKVESLGSDGNVLSSKVGDYIKFLRYIRSN